MLKIYENQENYTCQVIKLPIKVDVPGLDKLTSVTHQGNTCLISKDSNPDELYLFFPVECQISHEFLSANNLYRHSELNDDKNKTGFFEDNRRVKAIKFRGIISSGFIIPILSLSQFYRKDIGYNFDLDEGLKVGDEFHEIDDVEICKKYTKKPIRERKEKSPRVDNRMTPEHPDTSHLLKNVHKLNLDDYIAVTYKLHGTSARYFNTLVKRKLSLLERVSKFLGVKVQEYSYELVCASRRCLKSIGLKELPDKNHYYEKDLWSAVGKEFFESKLNHGEAVYCEIIGKTYTGQAIQHGYTYGFEKPEVFVYRISNINPQGIEVDLSYQQMKERCTQLGLKYCPELFYGALKVFILKMQMDQSFKKYKKYEKTKEFEKEDLEVELNNIFYNHLLEQPSILDKSVIEEGFCIRKDTCNKPEIFKIKSKLFLLHEGNMADKEIVNIEDEQA